MKIQLDFDTPNGVQRVPLIDRRRPPDRQIRRDRSVRFAFSRVSTHRPRSVCRHWSALFHREDHFPPGGTVSPPQR